MRGLRAISKSLSELVDSLPANELSRVMDSALELIAKDHPNDVDIQDAIARFRHSGIPNPELSQKLAAKSAQRDREYIELEEMGDLESSERRYRVMCVLDGLSRLLKAKELSLKIVDDVIYDLGFGSANADDFGKSLEEMLRS